MYTWEIEKAIGENNGVLDSNTYIDICNNSPQIKSIKYEAFTNIFKIWTSDKREEMMFKVVYRK